MPVKNITTHVFLIIMLIILLSIGCDRFHKASVIVDPRTIKPSAEITDEVLEQKFISTVKEFSKEINFYCRTVFQPPELLECGPAWHRKITLYRKDKIYIIELYEMHPGWGTSPYFCGVQEQMFEHFLKKFGKENIRIETNDFCGKKSGP